ncbi:uncharacterized protein MELLADRAFT_91496 [Melampsora larici-populina 98AG31]|uniref:Uncharacterized protein n=1 Tax=Melampsora larici-populina (strain 98AG31 / pathotype 3-4-7) TaxID=747676 RepID=F4RZ89_MELLP|nr:uncharacterized protein MELLADRAFT_91496 [Melampsora larici-populina 98AG31]EGG02183.1 hypothetical protein MELLADRAFT_91496 [Melampsora larici-populina 98AG31]
MIHTTDGYDNHHEIHQDFHNQIASLYTVQEAKTINESLAALDSTAKPKVVLLVDGELCDKEYASVIKKVSSYAKQGGTVIMCLNFASALKPSATKSIFQRDLGLTWKLGAIMRQNFSLNEMFNDVFNTPLQSDYTVKAQHISRASEHSQIYMVNDQVKLESPVIFERYTEKGFIGYIGDVNNEPGSQAVLLAMLDKAILKVTQLPRLEPTEVSDGHTSAGLGSQDPQPEESTTSQSDTIQPTAPDTQSTEPNASKAKKKKKKKKSKAKSDQPNAESSQQSDPQSHVPPFAASAGLPFNLGNDPLSCTHLDLSTMTFSPTATLNANTSRPAPSNSSSASLQAIFSGRLNLLEGHPQGEIYKRIIDLYRLRCDDECVWDGVRVGLYATDKGPGLPIAHFQSYLTKAQRCPNYLPSWWNEKAKEECIRIACDPQGKTYIGTRMAKADIQKAYNDSSMPMLMRMIGEKIFGSRIGAGSSDMHVDKSGVQILVYLYHCVSSVFSFQRLKNYCCLQHERIFVEFLPCSQLAVEF